MSLAVSHRSPGPWRLCYTRCYTGEHVSTANEQEQADSRGQVADANRNARFGERQIITSLPTVTALRSHGTRYPPFWRRPLLPGVADRDVQIWII
jgi:hypothetical protein